MSNPSGGADWQDNRSKYEIGYDEGYKVGRLSLVCDLLVILNDAKNNNIPDNIICNSIGGLIVKETSKIGK